ncbi:ATP-binding protein [Methanomethylophilus alvi]|uniref:ATP-binding protein n=1 Tax=Methanomethylophilus alvi TaxID=1291540 RepID=UPI0037DD16FD
MDFTAVMGNDVEYYQVAMTILSEETKKREFGSLEAIRDNFPKIVLTMDRFNLGNFGGIRVVNVIDWMLGR